MHNCPAMGDDRGWGCDRGGARCGERYTGKFRGGREALPGNKEN